MDPSACRENLATLLSQEVSALTELAGCLEREYALLVANDVERLEAAMEERQVALGTLLRVEDERRSLCRTHGHGVDASGLERLLAWCDPRGTLRALWAQCAQGAGRCRDLNDKNGALVHARMRRVENALGVLTGRSAEAQTYGPKDAYAAHRSGRVLAVEV